MSDESTLDLEEVDPKTWRVQVSGTVYGPYTRGQMASFISEGRLTCTSLATDSADGTFQALGRLEAFASAFDRAEEDERAGEEGVASNFLIVAQIQGGVHDQLARALADFGRVAELMPGVFLLRSAARLGQIRTRLAAVAESIDRLVIVDAGANRLAWLGLGPGMDAAIRRVWNVEL